ncbi:MAG: Tim44/TimA family putative adaptor protein [Hyphomicrobiales bacterium]
MNEAFNPFNLVILAVAIIIFWRLRGMLGRRTGHERKPYDPFGGAEQADQASDSNTNGNVVTLPGRNQEQPADLDDGDDRTPVWEGVAEQGTPLAATLEKIVESDREFHPQRFLDGAKVAYEMIVMAFASGDRKALKSLLSRDVFEGFDGAIDERESRGDVVESSFVGIDKAAIIDASLKAKTANVTVKFISQIISSTHDKEGRVIDGDPKKVREVTDIWTFVRDVSSRDPNWKLVATEAAN